MCTIALYGGSFDPPHIAHETIVKELLKVRGIDKVILMPTFLNPFKTSFHAPSELRLKWLKTIFASEKNVIVDSFEVDLQRSVPSIESVKYLLDKYTKIFLVIGADNLHSLSKWKNFEELESLVTFIVASRDGIEIPKKYMQLKIKEDISSTQLRENLDTSKLSPLCVDEIVKFYKEKNG